MRKEPSQMGCVFLQEEPGIFLSSSLSSSSKQLAIWRPGRRVLLDTGSNLQNCEKWISTAEIQRKAKTKNLLWDVGWTIHGCVSLTLYDVRLASKPFKIPVVGKGFTLDSQRSWHHSSRRWWQRWQRAARSRTKGRHRTVLFPQITYVWVDPGEWSSLCGQVFPLSNVLYWLSWKCVSSGWF